MTEQTPHWLVATDLDGTLLDETYNYHAAAATIDDVCAEGDLIVALASSKTLVEMLDIASRARSRPLLIFENGAGIAWHPHSLPLQGDFERGGYQVLSQASTADSYEGLRKLLQSWRERYNLRFTGFGDCTDVEVAAMTGLSAEAANQAKERLFTEPLIWQDSAEQKTLFENLLAARKLKLIAGGRFLHVMPPGDKAAAVAKLRLLLEEQSGCSLSLLACGDADNDLDMLKLADLALVFPGPTGGYLLPRSKHVHHACRPGAAGWRRGVTTALHLDSPNTSPSPETDNATDTDQ